MSVHDPQLLGAAVARTQSRQVAPVNRSCNAAREAGNLSKVGPMIDFSDEGLG
jgi:hypothetical protein